MNKKNVVKYNPFAFETLYKFVEGTLNEDVWKIIYNFMKAKYKKEDECKLSLSYDNNNPLQIRILYPYYHRELNKYLYSFNYFNSSRCSYMSGISMYAHEDNIHKIET